MEVENEQHFKTRMLMIQLKDEMKRERAIEEERINSLRGIKRGFEKGRLMIKDIGGFILHL